MATLREAVERRESLHGPRPPRSYEPWTAEGLARLIAGNVAGVLLIGLGWYQSSGQGDIRTDLSWLEVTIAGALLAGIVDAAWLMRGRRRVRAAVAAALDPILTADLEGGTAKSPDRAAEVLLWVPGTQRMHDAGCPLVRGKDMRVATAAQRRSLTRCEVCLDL